MATSKSLGGQKTKLSANVKAGEVGVNEPKMEKYYNDMLSQYDKVQSSLTALATLANNAVKKQTVKGVLATQLKNLKTKCTNQAKYAGNRKTELQKAYKEACKDDVIRKLTERVTNLEESLAKLSTEK